MNTEKNLTNGPILSTLLRFAVPVILAIFLQGLYGAVDLLVVGHFATTADVSGVSNGSQLMFTITNLIAALAMGVTVLVGNKIGENKPEEAGHAIGSAICLFSVITLLFMAFLIPGAKLVAKIMMVPSESFDKVVSYVRICSYGFLFITAYNLIGCIFRGIGDSKTPLITVSISCVLNIVCDIVFVRDFGMGTQGAAWATVLSQAVSVITSIFLIRKKQLPIKLSSKDIYFDWKTINTELKIGIPIALQDLLVGLSFMIILAVVNKLGVIESAAMGVGEKVCMFLMLIPSAMSQSLTAFVAQNAGANLHLRNKKALTYSIVTSLTFGIILSYVSFFHGDVLASIFANDGAVITSAHSYLKAYAIDCILTPIMFCMVGFFNGYRKTNFVMAQGILSAFLIRSPWALFWGNRANTTLFKIGLGTPCTTFCQIIVCLVMYKFFTKQNKELFK